MSKKLEAVYENGVLRPLEPLDLREHERVTVIVSVTSVPEEEWLDMDCLRFCESQADESIHLETVRTVLAKIPGSLTEDFIAERAER